jgi:3-methyl-2-oxobutanoate hydroxymethyltransferase
MTQQITRLTPADIHARKGGEPVVCLTAYTAPIAARLDPYVDLLLVGDSVGMALYGMENTLSVDLDTMIRHGQAVMRRAQQACVVVDMPFGTYEHSLDEAYRNAARIIEETGCHAVKLEGGADMEATIEYLTTRNISVMGHIGLMPQSVIKEGGYRVKGKTIEGEEQLILDAKAVENAGAFSLVLEGTVDEAAIHVTQAVGIPVIGIGASAACDGQVLVIDDMLGMLDGHKPKFAKPYAQLGSLIETAAAQYRDEVRARIFPSAEYLYHRPKKS